MLPPIPPHAFVFLFLFSPSLLRSMRRSRTARPCRPGTMTGLLSIVTAGEEAMQPWSNAPAGRLRAAQPFHASASYAGIPPPVDTSSTCPVSAGIWVRWLDGTRETDGRALTTLPPVRTACSLDNVSPAQDGCTVGATKEGCHVTLTIDVEIR